MFAGQLLEILDILEEGGLREGDRSQDKKLRQILAKDRDALTAAINRYLWDEETGFYYDLQKDGRRSPVKTAAAFWALASGAASEHQAWRLVDQLQNPRTFKRLHRVPVCAATEEDYDPRGGYWRGSVWAPINTMILYGLEKYGRPQLAREIALNHLDAVAQVWKTTGAIWENYPPDSIGPGDADKKDFVGWSGIGPIRYLLRYAVGLVPDAPACRLLWNLDAGILEKGPLGCAHFRFGETEVDLLARRQNGGLYITAASAKPCILEIAAGNIHEQRRLNGFQEFILEI
jgi:glycogen debranching enzyme